MKILVFAGMTNNKLASKLKPLLFHKNLSSIFLLRAFPMEIESITNLNPPRWMRRSVTLRELYRLYKALFLIPSKKIDYVIGIHYKMHSVFAGIFSKIFRLKCVFLVVENPKLYENNIIYFWFLKGCHKIGVRGSNSKSYLMSKGVASEKIFIAHNVFNCKKRVINLEKEFDLIFIGSFNQDKRPDIFLKIVKKLKKVKRHLKAVMLGDGIMFDEVQSYISNNNLEDIVYTAGYTSNIDSYLNKSKLLVMTSQTEGMPMVILEAMSFGVPCVVPDVGDITDVAINDYNSMVIKGLNIKHFSDAIVNCINDQILYKKLSNNSLKTIADNKEKYSIKSIAIEWEKVIK